MTPWQPEKNHVFLCLPHLRSLTHKTVFLGSTQTYQYIILYIYKPNSVMQILKNKPMSVHQTVTAPLHETVLITKVLIVIGE